MVSRRREAEEVAVSRIRSALLGLKKPPRHFPHVHGILKKVDGVTNNGSRAGGAVFTLRAGWFE
jgi:hypothetical protein